MSSFPVRRIVHFLPLLAVGCGLAAGPAAAQARLEAQYSATLAGLPVGNGAWIVDVSGDRYTMTATGQVNGLFRLVSQGNGNATVHGTINGTRVIPSAYNVRIRSRKISEVKMALAGLAVKSLSIEPVPDPDPDRIPVTDAHKRGVLDPISAAIAPRAGADGVGPEVCQRTLQIFDGRLRYDLTLSFKRTEKVQSEKGYRGPVAVCAVRYHPISGHEEERTATKVMRESRDIEVWLAPIAGTRFVAMYRAVMPTALGAAVIHATRFTAIPREDRAQASTGRALPGQ